MTVESENRDKDKDEDKEYWNGWYDFLGTEDPTWSIEKVKELLRGLIESGDIKEWANDEAILYRILDTKGLTEIQNRHRNFFKNLPEVVHIKKALEEIKEYANSDSNTPPDLSKYTGTHYDEEEDEEIGEANAEELAKLVTEDNEDPLDYGQIQTPKEILDKIGKVESISQDKEVMEMLVNHSINKLWKSIIHISDEIGIRSDKATDFLNSLKKNGNHYHDEVIDRFLGDYKGTIRLLDNLPKGYSYQYPPRLMQAYVAYKILKKRFFLNLSGVGAGKTLSAILASRAINSRLTVIVCPYDIVEQWEKTIKKVFPDSIVLTDREAFHIRRKESKHQYAVFNYEKFSLADSRSLILELTNQKIDFVILDEIHFAKRRGFDDTPHRRVTSQRNTNLSLLRSEVRKQNENIRVLGMTATPVINDLMECRSLIELVTGKEYKELSTNPTIRNAVVFYEKLQLMSVREMPDYHIHINPHDVEVNAYTDHDIIKLVRQPLQLEQILTLARIPEIIKSIQKEGKTIIFSEYVDEIIPQLRDVVKKEGYSYTEYTGSYKELDSFVYGNAQVLIASRPISIGVDGLQEVCDNLIINTLSWTNAQYQQLIGRLVRRGQVKYTVNVHIIKASINGYPYDERLKWNRIKYKRSLADCAVDGIMPLKNLVSVAEASKELKNWYNRLERNEVSIIERKDLDVQLTPMEIKQRIRVFGDFAMMNKQINKEKSETAHRRIQENPMYLVEYHRQMREAKKDWNGIIPVEIIADKIKLLQLPKYYRKLVVGDFGCGEAELALILSENKVHSFDHHNILNEEKITACDMKQTLLKDGELDAAVFSLSLMGTNWPDYIEEASRVLTDKGYLFIAETQRSLSAHGSLYGGEEGRLYDLKDVLEKEGFDVMAEEQRGRFTFIDAQKR